MMRAHTPPFTNPEAAYDSRRLYDETSAIAAAQDAKRAMTDAERESKLRTVAHYIYHAKLLMDEVFGTDRASHAAPPATPDFTIAQDPPDLPMGWLASGGVPVESAYLASFGPNDWQAETLREYGIGDVEPATLRGIPDSFIDARGNRITRRHPMHAEALRDHDERLFGGEDRL